MFLRYPGHATRRLPRGAHWIVLLVLLGMGLVAWRVEAPSSVPAPLSPNVGTVAPSEASARPDGGPNLRPAPRRIDAVFTPRLLPGLGDARLLGRGWTSPYVARYHHRYASVGTGPRWRTWAAEAAHAWLASRASPEGGWRREAPGGPNTDAATTGTLDVGTTGLALLAYLASGLTYRGDHPYRAVLWRGLFALRFAQDAAGAIGPQGAPEGERDHAVATLALVEAHALAGSRLWGSAAERGLAWIEAHAPWPLGDPAPERMQAASWASLALASDAVAQRAAGRGAGLGSRAAAAAAAARERRAALLLRWLEQVGERVVRGSSGQDPPAGDGRARAPDLPFELVAAALLVDGMLGSRQASTLWRTRAIEILEGAPPRWAPRPGAGGDPELDLVAWHFGFEAAHQVGGTTVVAWDGRLRAEVVAHQQTERTETARRGDWGVRDAADPDAGPVRATALLALCCQAAWRYDRGGVAR